MNNNLTADYRRSFFLRFFYGAFRHFRLHKNSEENLNFTHRYICGYFFVPTQNLKKTKKK